MIRSLFVLRPLVLSALLACCICSCREKKAPAPAAPPPKVQTTKVLQKSIPLYVHAIGNVTAYSTVNVMAQVSGQVTGAYFTEGALVKAGDPLFSIDSRSYKAALQQQEALLLQNAALLVYNEERVARYSGLVKNDFISQLDFENYTSSMEAYKAQVLQNQAAIEEAAINLGYCDITAPLTGFVGKRLVDPGNYVSENSQEALVVINQVEPIYVDFAIPEKYFTELMKFSKEKELSVMARVPGLDTQKPAVQSIGKLVFVNNAIEISTGTIPLRAQFDNADHNLWPGQFVEVFIELTTLEDACMVPSESVKLDTKGSWVYVVKSDNTLEQVRVTPGQVFHDQLAIQKGLKAGQTVVVKGQLSVRPGMKVTPVPLADEDSSTSGGSQ